MMTFFRKITAPLVMATALLALSCTSGSVEHVSGSISTPTVNADSVVVPFILVKHESAQSEFDDDEYTITFKIRISVIGPSGTYAKRADVSITSYAEDFPYVSSRIIPLLAGESYIVGSARIENFAAEVSSGFWAFMKPLQPILSRIDTNPETTL